MFACSSIRSLAAPRAQFHALAPLLQRSGVKARYLGRLRRPQLWRTFTEHDLLVMPSTTMENLGWSVGAQPGGRRPGRQAFMSAQLEASLI